MFEGYISSWKFVRSCCCYVGPYSPHPDHPQWAPPYMLKNDRYTSSTVQIMCIFSLNIVWVIKIIYCINQQCFATSTCVPATQPGTWTHACSAPVKLGSDQWILIIAITGLDIKLLYLLAWGASRFEKLLALQKSYWPEYCKQNMLLPRCPLL